ncbi:unnamed protein product [Camellia sinensis]
MYYRNFLRYYNEIRMRLRSVYDEARMQLRHGCKQQLPGKRERGNKWNGTPISLTQTIRVAPPRNGSDSQYQTHGVLRNPSSLPLFLFLFSMRSYTISGPGGQIPWEGMPLDVLVNPQQHPKINK